MFDLLIPGIEKMVREIDSEIECSITPWYYVFEKNERRTVIPRDTMHMLLRDDDFVDIESLIKRACGELNKT